MNQRGMTLIEVLLTIALSSLFFCALVPLFTQLYTMIDTLEKRELKALDIQSAIYLIQDEVRNASSIALWAAEGNYETPRNIEVFHTPEKIKEGETLYFRRMDLQSPMGEKKWIMLGTADGSQEKSYLKYKHGVFLENFHALVIRRMGHQLLLVIQVREAEGVYREYPFFIEQSYKKPIAKS